MRVDLTEAIAILKRQQAEDKAKLQLLERLQADSGTLRIHVSGKLRRSKEVTVSMPEKRGRKSMAPEERAEVSERMRKYWEGRKAAGEEPS